MAYDVARIRGQYTSLVGQWTYLNAHVRPQTPEPVASAVARAVRDQAIAWPHPENASITAYASQEPGQGMGVGTHTRHDTPGTLHADDHLKAARMAIADLTGTTTEAVILGPCEATLHAELRHAIAPMLRRGFAQWDIPAAAGLAGLITPKHYQDVVDGSTRLVAVPAANPHTGVIHEVAGIADYVHSRSRAWVLAEVTPLVGVRPINFDAIGADILLLNTKAIAGIEVAALAFRDPAMLRRIAALHPGQAGQAGQAREKGQTPGATRGALFAGALFAEEVSPVLAAGAAASVDHVAQLDEHARGTRRNRVSRSVDAAASYLGEIGTYLLDTLRHTNKVQLKGFEGAQAEADRIPVATFSVTGVPAATVHERLLMHGLLATTAHGEITVRLAPYNTHADIDQLARALGSLA